MCGVSLKEVFGLNLKTYFLPLGPVFPGQPAHVAEQLKDRRDDSRLKWFSRTLIRPLDRVSRGLKESHSLFPSWGGLLVGCCCLTFTVCISLLELTWKLTTASQCPGPNPASSHHHHQRRLPLRHTRLTKALTLSSSPSWPFSTALFNAHKSHTDRRWILGEGIDRDIWLLVDNMHNWGLWKQVISPWLRCVTHRRCPRSPASTAVEGVLCLNEQHTHYSTFFGLTIWKALH